jgi:hypothetical protein
MTEHMKRQRHFWNETAKYQRFEAMKVEVEVQLNTDETAKYQRLDRKEVDKNACIIDTNRYTEVKLENGQFLNRNGSYFSILLGKQSCPPGKYFFFKIIKETKTSLTVEELKQDENNPERFYLTGLKNQYHGWVKCNGPLSKASRRIQLYE